MSSSTSSNNDPPSPTHSNGLNGQNVGPVTFFVPANQRNTSKISAATHAASKYFLKKGLFKY